MFLAQYEVLREQGHSPSEAFNETVEEATQSLYPLIGANGMDWMYEACSTTARRGAIDWSSRFKDALKPVFNDLYDSVKTGKETERSLTFNSQPDYRQKYEAEMQEIRDLEIWRAGKAVRFVSPRPVFPHSNTDFSIVDYVQRTRSKVVMLLCQYGSQGSVCGERERERVAVSLTKGMQIWASCIILFCTLQGRISVSGIAKSLFFTKIHFISFKHLCFD